jgi:hypothetical protein
VLIFWRRDSLDGSIYALSRVEMERLLRKTEVYKNIAGAKGKNNWTQYATTRSSWRNNGSKL